MYASNEENELVVRRLVENAQLQMHSRIFLTVEEAVSILALLDAARSVKSEAEP